MPELPEVERVRRTIEPAVVGARISRAELIRADFCCAARTGRASRATPADLLHGAVVQSVVRRGKQFALVAADGRVLCFHLGMSGQVVHTTPGSRTLELSHVHARWELDRQGKPGGTLHFRDPRRFGGLWAFPTVADLEQARWSSLGPDALQATGAHLAEVFKGSRRAVKAALLDQTVLAGVGNIYADEALFDARIHPMTPCRRLTIERLDRLAAAIRAVLSNAISAGGSTLRDFVDAQGSRGSYQRDHKVYGRAGESCTRCGVPLQSRQVAQRTTVFCPRCQDRKSGAGLPPGSSG